MIKSAIEKIRGLYQLTIKDESVSGFRGLFTPFKFVAGKIGINLLEGAGPKEKIHLGSSTRIDGGLKVNKGSTGEFRINGASDNTLFIEESTDFIGIGTNEPSTKLTIKDGELDIFDTTSNLGAESLNDGDFDATTYWEFQGGFSLNTTGKYAEFTAPSDTTYFEKINEGNLELLRDNNFIAGVIANASTSAGAAASSADDAGVYRWYESNDWTVEQNKATFEHSTGNESLLQQKIRAKAQTATPGITRRFLKLVYTITESTIADESGKFAIVLPGGSAQELKQTSVGTHTHYIYTATSLPTTNSNCHIVPVQLYFNYTGTTSTSSGDKITISNISLREVPGVLFQRTMAIDPVANEYYSLTYDISNRSGSPSCTVGTIFLNGGRFRTSKTMTLNSSNSLIIKQHPTLSGDFAIFVDFASPGETFRITNLVYKKIQSRVTTSAGALSIGGNLQIGAGAAATDYTLTFDGETNDGVITWLEDEDYFKFSKDVSAGWHGDASTIKVLPRDFVGNEDSAGAAIHFDDTGTIGIIPSDAAMELYAFVPIPVGKKATHVSVFGNNTRPVTVFESNVNSGTHTSKGSGNVGTEIDITDFNHSATNYLTIKINTNATTNVIYGATVTIADIV
tara:strand:- start:198 stop:2072 length:1875 start_codon:yes stop_codon:yes gene_type:complete